MSDAAWSREELRKAWGNRHTKARCNELLGRYEQIVKRDGAACDLCGVGRPMEFDHIVPRPKGGNELANMCLAHEFCNKLKGGMEHSAAQELIKESMAEELAAGREWPPYGWRAAEIFRNARYRTGDGIRTRMP